MVFLNLPAIKQHTSGNYIGIHKSCLSVFKLGPVFALFSWVMHSQQVKSISFWHS